MQLINPGRTGLTYSTGKLAGVLPKTWDGTGANPVCIIDVPDEVEAFVVTIGNTTKTLPAVNGNCYFPRPAPPAAGQPAAMTAASLSYTVGKCVINGVETALNQTATCSAALGTPAMAVDAADGWPWSFRWAGVSSAQPVPTGLPLIETTGLTLGWYTANGLWLSLPGLLTETSEQSEALWQDGNVATVPTVAAGQVATVKKNTYVTVAVPPSDLTALQTVTDLPFVYVGNTGYSPDSVSVEMAGNNYYIKTTITWPL